MSRYTANAYVRLFGGSIISSVYHNRSDAFYKRFVTKEWGGIPISKDREDNLDIEKGKNIDEQRSQILKNQTESGIGYHRLSKGRQLFDALALNPDLIIMDNYMDLSARLIITDPNTCEGYFARLNPSESNLTEGFLGGYLDPIEAVDYSLKIATFFTSLSPKTKMVMINFPYNTYNDKEREARTKKFERLYNHSAVLSIPCLTINKDYQTKDKQHFRIPQYAAYAAIINTKLGLDQL